MNTANTIEYRDFDLLSEERQQTFELSDKAYKDTDRAKKEISGYVRWILPGWNLSNLANETDIDIETIIFLSNYARTFWELRHNIGMIDPRAIGYLKGYKCDIDELKALIETQEGFELWQISRIIIELLEKNEWEIQAERDKKNEEDLARKEKWLQALITYFMWNDTPENRSHIQNSWIWNWEEHWELIVEYFGEIWISDINSEHLKNSVNYFVFWFLQRLDPTVNDVGIDTLVFQAYLMWFKWDFLNS